MTNLYVEALRWPDEAIDGKIYNAGYQNHKVKDIAKIVRNVVGEDVEIVTTPTNDVRSYRVSSEKIKQEVGLEPQHTIEDAVRDLVEAFKKGLVPDPMHDPRYYNIKMMQSIRMH
jgi:nucleoside-diphosphate-sugar epimerase